jgi:hypothetical protein
MAQLDALRAQVLFQVLLQRTKLKWRLRSGDNEVVGKRSRLGDVDQRDIQRFVFGKDIDGPLGE